MFKNYFISAYRNLIKYKVYTVINILGLVLGLTGCILIMLYVQDELSFDRWIPDADNIYRFESERINPAGSISPVVKAALRARRDLLDYFPEIEAASRLIDHDVVLSNQQQRYFETAWFVDDSFLQVFDLPIVAGDKMSALSNKSSMLISASSAYKYFGDQSPLGEVLQLDDQRDYRITGIFQDIPQRSHFDFDFLIPYDETDTLYGFGYSESWDAVEGYTYLRLAEGVDIAQLRSQLPQFLENYYPTQLLPTGRELADVRRPLLKNVRDIHLDPGGLGNIKPPGNRQMLVTLSLIALLVLGIACANFVNLSTVKSLGRAGEISVRKVVGAQRGQLTLQFLCETVLVSLLATAASMGLVELLLPTYNDLLGKDIVIAYFSDLTFLISLAFIIVAVGIVSGLYPALRLASHEPAQVLRSGHGSSGKLGWTQPILVTLQFAVSVGLIITTAVIFFQQLFVNDMDLGFSPGNKLLIRNVNEEFAREYREQLAQEIRQLPSVNDITFSVAAPSDLVGTGFSRRVSAPGYRDESFALYPKSIATNFFDVYDIPLQTGRSFSEQFGVDRFTWNSFSNVDGADISVSSVVLNTSAIDAAGFANAEEAIGKTIQMGNVRFEIIGVVGDFHFQSLRSAVTPNMYIFAPEDHITLTVSYMDGTDPQQLSSAINETWNRMIPEFPIAIEFLETNIEAQYQQDRLQFLLFTLFASLAIAIACLGLFALASHSVLQKTREIGIRKIHGALSLDIVQILLTQFSKPVVAANFLAWPVAFYAITQYLNGFQYRVEVGPLTFIVSSLAALLVAWLAIVFHAVNAANGNPADALRGDF